MNVHFSRDFGTISVSVDPENYEEDLLNGFEIEKTLQSKGWGFLMLAFLKGKEKFDEAVMKVKPTLQSERETAMHAARLNGFWEAVSLAGKIDEACKKFRSEKKKELEAIHEENFVDA